MEAAGLETPRGAFDGESLIPLLTQTGTLKRNSVYFHYPNYAFHKRNRLGGVVRQGKYKLIRWYDDDTAELYNLSSDLAEQHDLVGQESELAEKLRQKLDAWLAAGKAKMPRRIDPDN